MIGLLTGGVLLALGPGTPAFAVGVWVPTEAPLPGNAATNPQANLNAASCTGTNVCVAVGQYSTNSSGPAGVIETQSAGSWSAENVPLPSNAGVQYGGGPAGVSCPAAAACVAVGAYYDSNSLEEGLVESQSAEGWTPSEVPLPANTTYVPEVGAGELSAVSCPVAGSCVAVGTYAGTDSPQDGLIETLSSGTWSPLEAPVPVNWDPSRGGVALSGVACSQSNLCVAVGSYYTSAGEQGLLETLSADSWTATQAPMPAGGGGGSLAGVSCPVQGACEAVGQFALGTASAPLVETLSSGTWLPSQGPVPQNAGGTNAYDDNAYLLGVYCTAVSSCAAVGYYYANSAQEGLLDTLSAGSWSPLEAPLPTGTKTARWLDAVACVDAGSCLAVGSYQDPNGATQGLIEMAASRSSTTTLASSPQVATVGQPVTFSATVGPTDGGGSVSFSVDGVGVAGCSSQTLSAVGANEIAMCTTSSLVAGTHTVTADYSGDFAYGPSNAAISVLASPPVSVALAVSPNSPVYGDTETLSATVTAKSGNAAPTGTVSFGDPGSLCSAKLSTAGAASCTTDLDVGTFTIEAQYSGDANFEAAVGTTTVTVSRAPTTTAATATPAQLVKGKSESLGASVGGTPGQPLPTGSVSFSVNGTAVCSQVNLVNAAAACADSSPPVGSDTAEASYGGDSNNQPSRGITSFSVFNATGTTTFQSCSGGANGKLSLSPGLTNTGTVQAIDGTSTLTGCTGSYGVSSGTLSASLKTPKWTCATVKNAQLSGTLAYSGTGTITWNDGTTSSGSITAKATGKAGAERWVMTITGGRFAGTSTHPSKMTVAVSVAEPAGTSCPTSTELNLTNTSNAVFAAS